MLYPNWCFGHQKQVRWPSPFNLHLDSFFEEIPNLNREIWNSQHSTCYTQIGVLDTRSRSGHLLGRRPFNLHLDSFFEEISNLNRKIQAAFYLYQDSLTTVYQNNCKMLSFKSISPREHPRSIWPVKIVSRQYIRTTAKYPLSNLYAQGNIQGAFDLYQDSPTTVYQNNCKMLSFNSICPRQQPRSIWPVPKVCEEDSQRFTKSPPLLRAILLAFHDKIFWI